MSEWLTLLPPAVVVLAGAAVVPFASDRLGHAIGFVVTLVAAVWSISLPDGQYLVSRFLGFDVAWLFVDDLSRLMGFIFGLIGAVAILYSYWSQADGIQSAYALGYVGTSIGAVFVGDWLTLVVFWELMAITSTLLVWHHGGPAIRAGFRYGLWHAAGGSLVMAGAIWHYLEAGSVLFTASDGIAPGLPAALLALGVGVNVGFVGLHVWLPDTYPSPHLAASVFLCIYTTKTGVYALGRAFPDGWLVLAYMGGVMAVFGAYVALLQDDMRRLLSYHIQSQVGYMVAGVGIGSALAYSGAFAHVFNHILYKGLLFMTAGVIIYRTDTERLKKLGGLAREMPLTAVVFAIAALSIAGFPGFNGFVSKGMVVSAAHYEHLEVLRGLLLLGGVGTFLSFIKFGYFAFLGEPADPTRQVRDANWGQSIAMVFVAGLCILLGLYPDLLFEILPGAGATEAKPFTLEHIAEGLLLAGAGLLGFIILRGPLHRVGTIPDVDWVYNRVALYGTRGVVQLVGVVYGVADALAAGMANAAYRFVFDPAGGLSKTIERFPADSRLAELSPAAHGGTTYHLRSGIGRTVLAMVAFTLIVLLIVL